MNIRFNLLILCTTLCASQQLYSLNNSKLIQFKSQISHLKKNTSIEWLEQAGIAVVALGAVLITGFGLWRLTRTNKPSFTVKPPLDEPSNNTDQAAAIVSNNNSPSDTERVIPATNIANQSDSNVVVVEENLGASGLEKALKRFSSSGNSVTPVLADNDADLQILVDVRISNISSDIYKQGIEAEQISQFFNAKLSRSTYKSVKEAVDKSMQKFMKFTENQLYKSVVSETPGLLQQKTQQDFFRKNPDFYKRYFNWKNTQYIKAIGKLKDTDPMLFAEVVRGLEGNLKG